MKRSNLPTLQYTSKPDLRASTEKDEDELPELIDRDGDDNSNESEESIPELEK